MNKPGRETGRMLSYADIAELLDVQVQSVRIYAHSDPDFPTPITPPSLRSPGFSDVDVDAYIARRKERNIGKSGRPPQAPSTSRINGAELGERVRAALTAEDAPVHTMRALSEKLGISWVATRRRISGLARWTDRDLAILGDLFGTSLLDQTQVDAARPPAE